MNKNTIKERAYHLEIFEDVLDTFQDKRIRFFARRDEKTGYVLEIIPVFKVAHYERDGAQVFDFLSSYRDCIRKIVDTYNKELQEGKKPPVIEKQVHQFIVHDVKERLAFYEKVFTHGDRFINLYLDLKQ